MHEHGALETRSTVCGGGECLDASSQVTPWVQGKECTSWKLYAQILTYVRVDHHKLSRITAQALHRLSHHVRKIVLHAFWPRKIAESSRFSGKFSFPRSPPRRIAWEWFRRNELHCTRVQIAVERGAQVVEQVSSPLWHHALPRDRAQGATIFAAQLMPPRFPLLHRGAARHARVSTSS